MRNNNQASVQNLQPWERTSSIFGLQPWEQNTSIFGVQPWEMNKFINNNQSHVSSTIVAPKPIIMVPPAKLEVANKSEASKAISSNVSQLKAPIAQNVANESTAAASINAIEINKAPQIIAPDKSFSAKIFGPKKIEISNEGLTKLLVEQKANIKAESDTLPLGESVKEHVETINGNKSWLTAGQSINSSNEKIVAAPTNSSWLASWLGKNIPTAPQLNADAKFHPSTNVYTQIVDTIKKIVKAKLNSAAVNMFEEKKYNNSNVIIPEAVINQVEKQNENKALNEQRGCSIM